METPGTYARRWRSWKSQFASPDQTTIPSPRAVQCWAVAVYQLDNFFGTNSYDSAQNTHKTWFSAIAILPKGKVWSCIRAQTCTKPCLFKNTFKIWCPIKVLNHSVDSGCFNQLCPCPSFQCSEARWAFCEPSFCSKYFGRLASGGCGTTVNMCHGFRIWTVASRD